MPKATLGFDDIKKPKGLDFSGIPDSPPPLSPEREEAAVRAGEAMGFVEREPAFQNRNGETLEPIRQGRVRRMRPKRRKDTAQIFIKGPADVVDDFIAFVNESGYSAYWEGLRDLLQQRNIK